MINELLGMHMHQLEYVSRRLLTGWKTTEKTYDIARTRTAHNLETSNSTFNFCNLEGHAFSQFNAEPEYTELNFIKARGLSGLFILLMAFSKNSPIAFPQLWRIPLHFL